MRLTYCSVYHETGRIQKGEAKRLYGNSRDDAIFINRHAQNRAQEVIIILSILKDRQPGGTIIEGVGWVLHGRVLIKHG